MAGNAAQASREMPANGSDLFKFCADIPFWETDLPQPLDVGEFFASLLEKHYCAPEAEPPLKQSELHRSPSGE